jgi:hypothetical protein
MTSSPVAIRARVPFAALILALAVVPTAAQARTAAPHVSWAKCLRACTDKRTVAPGGAVKLAGRRLRTTARVMFPVRRANGTKAMRSMKPKAASSSRLVVGVPTNARTGRLYVRARHGLRSNLTGTIRIRKLPHTTSTSPSPTVVPPPSGTAFDGNGMWIWYVSKANGGDTGAIVAQAKAHGISTVFVKSGDGTSFWSQFTPQLVSDLKAGGLRVCAWQYVYGEQPGPEAAVAARAVQTGADCFVIDAESEYEGRYAQAQTYVNDLRQAVGTDYPIGLAAFPYVDYHPSFPYSVFLGPNGAQFNAPQAYWKAIGGGVDAVVDHTYRFNRPYGRTIAPLGQTYDSPPPSEIARFRQLVAFEGASGLSWWSWQHTDAAGWDAVGQPIDTLSSGPAPEFALIAKGKKGDIVLWAQQHLKGAGQSLTVDGDFGTGTENAVKSFQASAGLPVTGQIDTATWQALLQHPPAAAKWAARSSAPTIAKLPARRYEIPASSGARSGSGWHAAP